MVRGGVTSSGSSASVAGSGVEEVQHMNFVVRASQQSRSKDYRADTVQAAVYWRFSGDGHLWFRTMVPVGTVSRLLSARLELSI